MKYLVIAFSILTFTSCSTTPEKNQSNEQEDSTVISKAEMATTELIEPTLEQKEVEMEIIIEDLKGTLWIHRPFEEFPNCVDTLNFMNDTTGYEYRCEFELANKIDYFYSNDTLEIHEYGHVSEVHDLGLEIKYRLQYVRTNNKLNLTGYIKGKQKPIAPTTNDITYELLKLSE